MSCMTAFAAGCSPRSGPRDAAAYLGALVSGPCSRVVGSLTVAQGVFNVLGDLYLIILPLVAVWGLQMPTKKKAGVSLMFLTGIA